MREITTQDKYTWIRQQIQTKTQTYPQLVKRGILTSEEAEHLLAVQHHILNDYELLLEREAPLHA